MIQPPLGLLTHLVALRSALDEQWAARATQPVVHLYSPPHVTLELLPYAVSEMWHAFTSFIGATHRMAATLGEDIPILPECFVLADADRDVLAYSIDAFMHAGRRAQNAVLPYLSRAFRQSLPARLSDVFTKHGHTDLRTYPVLDIFAPMLESYWQADGQRLRAYRVVMEHRPLVAREAFLARFGCRHRGPASAAAQQPRCGESDSADLWSSTGARAPLYGARVHRARAVCRVHDTAAAAPPSPAEGLHHRGEPHGPHQDGPRLSSNPLDRGHQRTDQAARPGIGASPMSQGVSGRRGGPMPHVHAIAGIDCGAVLPAWLPVANQPGGAQCGSTTSASATPTR